MQINTKKSLPLKFLYPVYETSRLNGLLKQINHGDIAVTANYNPDGSIDFDTIMWNGCDIYSLLAYIPEGAELISTLTDAAKSHIESIEPFDLWMETQSQLQLLKSAL